MPSFTAFSDAELAATLVCQAALIEACIEANRLDPDNRQAKDIFDIALVIWHGADNEIYRRRNAEVAA